MVTCMAVALGTPNDSNHLYLRMFDPHQLANTCAPGSDDPKKRNTDVGV
jgi:hypothetical protein